VVEWVDEAVVAEVRLTGEVLASRELATLLTETWMSSPLAEVLMSSLLIEVLDILAPVVEVSASSLLNTPKMGTSSRTVTSFSIKPT